MSERLQELGVTHVATDVGPGSGVLDSSLLAEDPHFAPLLEGVEAFLGMLEDRTVLIHEQDGFYLYELVRKMQIEQPFAEASQNLTGLRSGT